MNQATHVQFYAKLSNKRPGDYMSAIRQIICVHTNFYERSGTRPHYAGVVAIGFTRIACDPRESIWSHLLCDTSIFVLKKVPFTQRTAES